MNAGESRARRRKPLAAGVFQPEISSFRLALAAEGKAAKTVRNYTEAVQWFAAAHLLPQTFCTRWEQVSGQDIQWWMVWLLSRYSDSYASNQYRALQQFFKWWAGEERPDPMARLRPPKVTGKLVPVFTSEAQFYARFDHIVLLSAPPETLIERLESRTSNSYGKAPEELSRVLDDLRNVEPLLRRVADHEVRTTMPLDDVVAAILRLAGA
jgi:hypothetical protein